MPEEKERKKDPEHAESKHRVRARSKLRCGCFARSVGLWRRRFGLGALVCGGSGRAFGGGKVGALAKGRFFAASEFVGDAVESHDVGLG